jgi:predicted Na+-dependent transporter
VETQGPLAVIWVAAGLIAFYIALIWINSLLGLFLTPLFIIPLTWFQDKMKKRKARKSQKR